ncbi:hypothetical protein [Sinisalibacter aestuarii]|uniref:Uncharacterized protein n=1 Tax=Sinisalibacter aestuarii TaxID=2949426 RepID=A0ABQ5LWY2_9RHOB|nr:hypothetical protein [Sinisalibacter aestuarii]GKY89492.1 hypothetical protein STA1M1_33610 [Sinisalibacter aestuarii]
MKLLIVIGVIVSAIGLVGLVVSLLRVLKARRAGLSDEALKEAVARAMPLNMGAFALSALGLMMVVVGVILA